jgi:sigma-B regulation protein RsbU (phosphoserine phosphatase)
MRDEPAQEDLEDLYENAPCGYLSLGPDGRIVKVNQTLASWLDCPKEQLPGKRVSDLLTIAGRIFYETHVAPLLRMQGFFNEFALDMIREGGEPLPVIVNAVERRSDDGAVLFTRYTIFKAVDRRRYERELLNARTEAERLKKETEALYASLQNTLKSEREIAELREQFVAVLGHDLRNPLASLSAGARLMLASKTPEDAVKLERMMQASINRMARLIDSVMDFARGRMGGGIALKDKQATDLEPVLRLVVEELVLDHPGREIQTSLTLAQPVSCDRERLGQLFSNLLGNAMTHGDPAQPVRVAAATHADSFEFSVANAGERIPEEILPHLFEPFYRGRRQPSKQGLGLGLYISSQIAKAHGGWLDVTSDDSETRFTLIMPIK